MNCMKSTLAIWICYRGKQLLLAQQNSRITSQVFGRNAELFGQLVFLVIYKFRQGVGSETEPIVTALLVVAS